MNKVLDEKKLLISIANDDRKAFNELYKYYMHNLYRYVYFICKSTEITEEVVQEIFVKMWLNRVDLPKVQFFKSYLYRSAQNLLMDQLRRVQLQHKAMERMQAADMECALPSDSAIICNEFIQLTREAINHLPAKRKIIVELRTEDGLSLDEIAHRLRISKSVVKKQLYIGLAFVRNYIHHFDELAILLIFLHFYLK
jgi:RNA polymerase sigma-70 factor (family 1)